MGHRMKFSIRKETVSGATRCNDNFSCLKGSSTCLCEVEDCADGKIHFIKPANLDFPCEYQSPFGYVFTCNCPVRKEIYNVYQV